MPRTYANLRYHLVFATKNRMPLITPDLRGPLYGYINGIVENHGGRLIEAGGMPDHLHLLAGFRPRYSVSEMLKEIKGSSSRWVNDRAEQEQAFAWQEGYGAFTVSESQVPQVREYIRHQERHHRNRSSAQELAILLRRHGIDFAESDL